MKKRTGFLVKRGATYYARWNVNGKAFQQSTGKKDKRQAQTELDRIMTPFLLQDREKTLEHLKGEIDGTRTALVKIEEERNPPLLLSQAWNAFEKSPNRPDSGERTLWDYAGHLDGFCKWLTEHFKSARTLRDVTPEMAEGYAEHLTGLKLQANSFNKKVQALSLIFRVLSEPGRLTANVWDKIRRKRQVSQSRRELTVEELKRIVEGAKGEMRLLLGIGIYTGLRLGDCSTLRWGEVDLVRRIIRRIPMKTARRKATPVIVPIHGTLLNMLKQLPRNAKSDYVLPEIAATYARDDSAVSKQIQKLFSDNGITTTRDGTGYILVQGEDGKQKKQYTGKRAVVEVGFHSLRHTFVSLCRGADAPLSVVESIVGHSSPAMTQHYSHTGETALRDAVTSLPDITGETVKALPAAVVEDEAATLKAKIKEIAGKLTARNAGKMKTALLTLAG